MLRDERPEHGVDLTFPARSCEDAVVPYALLQVVTLPLRRDRRAQSVRCLGLTGRAHVVLRAFDREQRGRSDVGRVDALAAPGELAPRQVVVHEDALQRLQVELRRDVHHRAVLVVEVADPRRRLLVPCGQCAAEVHVGCHVPSDVQRHERRQLGRTRIDPTAGTGVLRRHLRREEAFVQGQGTPLGHRIDPVRVDPRVDGAGHERETPRLRGVAGCREQGDGREHEGRRLADGQDVGVGPEMPHRLEDVVDVLVEPETTGRHRDVAGVVPIDHEHVVVGQEGADRGPQQRREVPGDGPHEQHLRLVAHLGLGEVQHAGERRRDRGPDVDLGHPAVDHHRVDAPVGPVVGGAGRGHDLADCPNCTRAGVTGQRCGEALECPRGHRRRDPARSRQSLLPHICACRALARSSSIGVACATRRHANRR